MGCEGSLGSLMTSTPRTLVPCERTQYQDTNNHNTTPHTITLSDREDVEVYDSACDNASLTQTSAEEEEICFGMVLPQMQMITIKATRRLTRLQTDLRCESSRVESVSARRSLFFEPS
jgi:hypothetical protein